MFLVQVGPKTNLTGNTAQANTYGFFLYFANNATLTGNTATQNENGFFVVNSNVLHATRNTATLNTNAVGNAYGISLSGGERHTLTRNIVTNNNGGITVTLGTKGELIAHNTVTGNVGFSSTVYDLEDGNQGCVVNEIPRPIPNRWVGNTFNTANQTCIH